MRDQGVVDNNRGDGRSRESKWDQPHGHRKSHQDLDNTKEGASHGLAKSRSSDKDMDHVRGLAGNIKRDHNNLLQDLNNKLNLVTEKLVVVER